MPAGIRRLEMARVCYFYLWNRTHFPGRPQQSIEPAGKLDIAHYVGFWYRSWVVLEIPVRVWMGDYAGLGILIILASSHRSAQNRW